jgi:hypothetical protein
MKNEQTYNGWTNYATWRVNMELWGDYDIEEFKGLDVYDLSIAIKERTEEYIIDCSSDNLCRDYALSFVNEVNFYEIAEMLFKDNQIETEKI